MPFTTFMRDYQIFLTNFIKILTKKVNKFLLIK